MLKPAMAALALLAGTVSGTANETQGTHDPFDPRHYADHVHGNVTEVYVLGTAHLAQVEGFDPAALSALLDRLEALAPDVITIEALGPETIFLMQAYDARYDGAVGFFARAALEGVSLAGEETGLDMPQARVAVDQALAGWPDAPSASERRHLSALFAASGDINSALVQWLRLEPAGRVPGDGVTEALAALLERVSTSHNENVQIAVALAVRLGHERVYPADDHTASHLMGRVAGPMTAALETPEFASIFDHPVFTEAALEAEHWQSPAAMLAYFRRVNSPEHGQMDVEGQWQVMIDRAWPENAGRVRIAEWDTRNLRMAAHIREASADAVGGRVLSIVGAAHKPWLDAYLEMMTDMRSGDMLAVLD
ncbi:DUF5694 domain-containing protein [Glycocaulis sp.]|uniref:DUF5694 domain-containing protein n=1 Tax=Glycocaulis sp. TaxID=1969725 RepID=UPI0025B94B9D|nr:DUF5694 domain-containing protein [Glycocaulis sp.]MCH8522577.1 DUF5694 domain-containing protein [Glycocaulis sp.]